jgi:hypothetical protein
MRIPRNAHAGSSSRKRKMSEKKALAFALLQSKCPSQIKAIDLASLTVEEKAARAKAMNAVRVSERHHAYMQRFLCSQTLHACVHRRVKITYYDNHNPRAGEEQEGA